MPATRVVLIADVVKGVLDPAVWDLAAMADRMAGQDGIDVRWVAVGHQAAEAGGRLAEGTGYPLTAVELAPAAAPTGAVWYAMLLPILDGWRPDVIGMLHTTRALDYAAALAVALDAAWIAAVQGIVAKEKGLIFQRAVLGGRLTADIRSDGRPMVVTVLPGYFKHKDRQRAPARIEMRRPPQPSTRIRLVETRESNTETALRQAETIIAAGQGIGSKDNLALIEKLADCFPRSAVAGSRIVCDTGWLPYNRQVGVTGASVAPKLYLACGISGAPQHVGGMQGAELIVAVNKDPHAAIFNWADIGVVEDLEVFLPLLIEALGKEELATD